MEHLYQQFTKLSNADIADYMSLQAKVEKISVLACGNPAIKLRDEGQLAAHLDAGMPILGMRDDRNGQLTAGLMVTLPDNGAAKHLDGYPLHQKLSDIFIIQGLYVHPDLRGQGLGGRLIAQAFNICSPSNRLTAVAKYASERTSSKLVFERAGFSLIAQGQDPLYGHDVDYVAKTEKPTIKRGVGMPTSLPEGSQFRYA